MRLGMGLGQRTARCAARYALSAFVLLLCVAATAQVEWEALLERSQPEAGQVFSLVFELSGAQGRDFQAPDFGGLEVISGPNRSSSYTILNQQVTGSERISYQLLAPKAGSYRIPAASIRLSNGKTLRTKALELEAREPDELQSKGSIRAGDEVAVELRLSSDTVYVGEAVKLFADLHMAGDVHTFTVLGSPGYKELTGETLRRFDRNARVSHAC